LSELDLAVENVGGRVDVADGNLNAFVDSFPAAAVESVEYSSVVVP